MQEPEKQRILIVDDATENIDIITSVLTRYKKSIATNGEKALQIAFSENPPDLILLDIVMPGIDGYEVCKRLKADERTKHIPVIFLTGETGSESVVKGFGLGAVDYVTKPFNISELIARVNTQMTLKSSQDAVARYTKDIEYKNKQITDSINYAMRIQQAILPSIELIYAAFPQSFVFYQPKDVVSGDFYAFFEKEDCYVIAVADCTGHGVPGAFMSMIGKEKLSQIIIEKGVTQPSEILDHLHKGIQTALGQNKGNSNENKDGMDIVVCKVYKNNKQLEYAGANRPLWLIRDKQLMETKADKQPIGGHDGEYRKPFTNQSIELLKGDLFFLFSDGYADQFGGERGKKFMLKNLKELLLDTSVNNIQVQKSKIVEAHENWKKGHEQVDDVLLIGLKF